MRRKTIFFLVIVLLLACGGAAASPKTAVISTHTASTWLPADINQKACELVDNYLVDRYEAILFDGAKATDKKEMAKRIGPTFADYVIVIQITGFYDPPFTVTHLSSDAKPADTVAIALMDYSVYITALDRWTTGRVHQRMVYANTAMPPDKACLEAVRQTLPKLADKLAGVVR